MRDELPFAILRMLEDHVGRENAISLETLFFQLRLRGYDAVTESSLRGVIHDMRKDGYLIASGQEGYYLPATLSEAMEYVDQQFREPAKDQLVTARRQRQAAINLFGGQYSMFPRGAYAGKSKVYPDRR